MKLWDDSSMVASQLLAQVMLTGKFFCRRYELSVFFIVFLLFDIFCYFALTKLFVETNSATFKKRL